MIERGKYQSLTMINWNGFFARTFDIDDLVTTLSGGNGAGKSTTMAAFITALIPDQSLLHFRNTTEAGSSQASRDKGLFGKLQPGTCYSCLDVVNSKKQRLMFVVKLQQVAGRDKKVDIKPFLIQGLPSGTRPTDILTETLASGQARVRQLNEVKDVVSSIEGVHFKTFNSIVDYHTQMFEFGVVPKKLRSSSDRAKFYRLIEASLYGGISSAITRSLRDYLLPQNGGVKKAFQDMESALRENRMTLEAIKTTQADRDLFKHLITESTNYVAADYMRHANERRIKLASALELRQELLSSQSTILEQNELLQSVAQELSELNEQESGAELDYQSASDHLQLVQSALRQKEKIERYREDLEELQYRLEEQVMVVEEAHEKVMSGEEQFAHFEEEVDSLKTQLADYQQALDIQQTRALQYQQAYQLLVQAKSDLNDDSLSVDTISDYISELNQQQSSLTDELLSTKHKLDIVTAAANNFDKAFQLVLKVYPDAARSEAKTLAEKALNEKLSNERLLENESQWRDSLVTLKSRLKTAAEVVGLRDQYQQAHQVEINNAEEAELELERSSATADELARSLEEVREERRGVSAKIEQCNSEVSELQKIAPAWIEAQRSLQHLQEQRDITFESQAGVLTEMQKVLELERIQTSSKEELYRKRETLEQEISRLASPGGANDPRLKALADSLGGVLLSEIYDDITMEDAPYFSAMYGPARHAIVVSDLDGVKESLNNLEDCPDDIYVIEGDVDAFDDSSFNTEELDGAVCVQLNDRQLRYSRFPKIPLFGRAAREHRLELLREQRDDVVELHAKAAFDSQKLHRQYQAFNEFVSHHISVAFNDDPEAKIDIKRKELSSLEPKLRALVSQEEQLKSSISENQRAQNALDKIMRNIDGLEESELLIEKQADLELKLERIDEAKAYNQQYGRTIELLETCVSGLEVDPEEKDILDARYQKADAELQELKRKLFSLSNLYERRHHLNYEESVSLADHSSELSEQLKQQLLIAEERRAKAREDLKVNQQQLNQCNQLLASLKSAHQSKLETVQEFEQELGEYGVNADDSALERAEQRKSQLYAQLSTIRTRRTEIERTITATELEMSALTKRLKKVKKEYGDTRKFVVNAKAGWCAVLKLAKQNDVDRRLNKRELAYLSADELRSMSDKALGSLRIAVANNEILRDVLRHSEDNARPEKKVLFYIAVYQHLRERIRQDIIRTDDPVEAIEEMEVELARLTEELNQREMRLAISSDSVSSIIRKTIQREENRIRMLNQGLSNIHFGQVNGVRLNVKVRESHETLLSSLAEQQSQHKDLFESAKYSFSEAMAKLFQRVNPHIDLGQRSPQIFGEELLDYRNYLELSVEVNRGSDGWLQAESGALSTGEAIGTGQSILLMVVQSWEEESRRLRSKDIVPCRLLFLDEAARLDAKSISTLFELCDRLDMQLLIAAPENISPEKGTTYKLVRKVFKDREHVHVVGLKGFGSKSESQVGEPQVH
ncbi:chromosome partition protein MukB [Vibrio viridaestus]|uniref:Chromosome partition protein MukB n=1 Tax=Vibrio viridaestus TaxID=2487322 RepID=A0A3N9U1Y8_9VIBR|nr:chromosome partition protein MukB [Vibrio viridaestus]RQW61946.1 chromosome partition protein MukB [Vibrio viridaestus]